MQALGKLRGEGSAGGRLKTWTGALIALAVATASAAKARAEDLSAWSHAADFRIDTRPQGADVAGNVIDFPLLIRLDSTTMPFAEAKPDGSDLRVSGQDGTALSFEIGRWDRASKRAEVWIRVPLIQGNSDAGFVRLHWGNAVAGTASSGKAVFDSSQGWSGVWHLDDSILSDAAGVSASADGSLSQGGEGLIAGGRQLMGNAGGLAVANGPALNPVVAITVSAWIRADSWAGMAKVLFQKGTDAVQYALIQEGADSLAWILGGPAQGAVLKAPLPAAGAWHLVAASYDGSVSRIFVDGRLAASQSASGLLTASPDGLCLGNRTAASGKPRNGFKGMMDEIRISRIALGADFQKLAFANQKSQQVLVLRPRLDGCRAVFGVPPDTTVAEGSDLVLRGKAECADAWTWIPVSGPAPRILDPEVADLAIAVPRITRDTLIAYRFSARFGDSTVSRDVAVRIREAIPDPEFALGPFPKWNGKDPMQLRPVILNLAALKASRDTLIRYAWTLAGPPIDTAIANDALILKRGSEAGILAVGLCLDNGGAAVCRSMDMDVAPGIGVGLADPRKPMSKDARLFVYRNAIGRVIGTEAGSARLYKASVSTRLGAH